MSSVESMSGTMDVAHDVFVDRRNYDAGGLVPSRERRQFTNSHDGLSADAKELALAIDGYKLHHRRRFITYEEMLTVIQGLGYRK